MMHSRKKRLAVGLALTVTLGSGLLSTSGIQAEPAQFSAFVGTGSDTTQEVMNAATGYTNGIYYTPINSGAATGRTQVISFDATLPAGVADTCVTTKLGGPTFTRPNGSTAGRRALYAASGLSATGWTGSAIGTTPICATAVDISGQVDFARSSAGPSAGDAGTDITYVPFGRGAMSVGYYRAAGSPVTDFTLAQINALFQSGPQNIDPDGAGPLPAVRVVPCGIQVGSGTYQFWQTVNGSTAGQEVSATALCNGLLAEGRAEENDALDLKNRGDALALLAGESGSQVVIGFGVDPYIAKANHVAFGPDPVANNVGISTISNATVPPAAPVNLGSPIAGTAPNLTPVAGFYNNATFGRNLYNVLPTSVAIGAGNAAIKAIFVGSTSALCSATSMVQSFGILSLGAGCGSTALKGSWITGAS